MPFTTTMHSLIDEQAVDSPTEFEGESEGEETQCFEADLQMSHMSHSHESPEGSQGEPVPGSSQRDQRQDKRKTKQRNVNEALFQARKDAEDIKRMKLAGKCPSPPQRERSTESKSHVWKFFKMIYVEGEKYTQCNFCSQEYKYVGSSTTTMSNHLKRKHQNELDKAQGTGLEKQSPKINHFVQRPAAWKRDGRISVEWERKIIKFVVSTS